MAAKITFMNAIGALWCSRSMTHSTKTLHGVLFV